MVGVVDRLHKTGSCGKLRFALEADEYHQVIDRSFREACRLLLSACAFAGHVEPFM